MSRVIVWFSRGAASAVAAKMAVAEYPPIKWPNRLFIVYCDTSQSEDIDGDRFQREAEQWIGHPITTIRSDKYGSIDDVFERERYMSGISGARCTVEMKKIPRMKFQEADDLHIFGFTVDESKRIMEFEQANPELHLDWILRDGFIRKKDCFRILREALIKPPLMYKLGFEHNNCVGCVKATSPTYWQRTAKHFPVTFQRRARQSRDIGARLVRIEGVRMFLDEMPLDARFDEPDGDIECGPFCINPDANAAT